MRTVALGLAVIAAALALGGPGAALAKKPPPPVIEAPPPPPPPPPMPAVGLGSRFVAEAATFQSYMRETHAISPAFSDAASLAAALRSGAAYEPGQLRRGAVALAAIAVLSDSRFVADVRRLGATPEGRYQIEAAIFASPSRALDFADGARAAGLAKAALNGAGMTLFRDGEAVRLEAYSMQHQPWSLSEVSDRVGRSAAVKMLSNAGRPPDPGDTATLEQLVQGGPSNLDPDGPTGGPYSPLVVRAVALAALAAIGEAGDDAQGRLGWLTDDYFLDHCLAETKLLLFECLAVAKPNFEDAFCLGLHAMKDTGACVVRSAGGVVPLELYARPIKLPKAHYGKHGAAKKRRHT